MKLLSLLGLLGIAGMGIGCYPYHAHDDGPIYYYEEPASTGFYLSWKIVDATYGPIDPIYAPAMSCEGAGVDTVQVDLLERDTLEHFAWAFDCRSFSGATPEVPFGVYIVTVDALDYYGAAKSRDTWTVDNYTTSNLGLVVFMVIP